jgi:peptidoglycan hydrolase-like protein with peptidoglycan-binding domain
MSRFSPSPARSATRAIAAPGAAMTSVLIAYSLFAGTSATLGAGRLPAVSLAPAVSPTPPTSSPAPAPPTGAPVAGRIKLVLEHVGGSPPFALIGETVAVRGIVVPYVGGQTVKLSFYREGRKVEVKEISVAAVGNGAGQFRADFASGYPGLVQVRAAHYGTSQQGAFSGSAPGLRFVNPNVGPGAHGQSVRLLQSELDVLHYAVPLSGVFDEGTGRALIAYRKVTGLERVPDAGRRVFALLARRAGDFHVRYPRDGRHVEADLTREVLAEIDPHGRVQAIYTMSSGKPSTPTVIGHFQVYSKTPGVNSEGMVDSNYFIRGYAIHGYAEVPTFAASHGCLRIPIPDAAAVYAWVRYGTPVDVYNESGGGSHHVRGNAGP